jgi:D-methionine transport system permease protein
MSTLIETIRAFEYWGEIGDGTVDTLIMTGLSLTFTVLVGLPVGVALFLTGPSQRSERPVSLVENLLREVDRGVFEAFRAMGATTRQTVLWAMLPETFPGLVAAITVTAIALIGYSAMSGVIGGGGLGDLAVRYGYQRFNVPVMVITVAILIVLVQLVQALGDRWVARLSHQR